MPVRFHPVIVFLALIVLCQASAQAQSTPDFPELTGRVVDRADMLPAKVERRLSQMLEAHEQSTTEQVVVVTLPNLQGYAIEDFGYQLGRHWGIGQEGEDNGALLLVAKDERRIRIEVGYGLEGRLTDATSATIINQIITPAFRQGILPPALPTVLRPWFRYWVVSHLRFRSPVARQPKTTGPIRRWASCFSSLC